MTEQEYDVVVVGSRCGGPVARTHRAHQGLSTLVVEKAPHYGWFHCAGRVAGVWIEQ